MISYLARRLVTSIIVIIGVSIFIFLLLHAIYPSPARQVLGLSARPAQIAAWNKSNGYDDPVIVQYFRYMNQLLHGNLGYSYAENQSVFALFQERVARSVYLSGISLLIAVIIALPLGIFQAVKRNSLGDNVATSAAFILYSMPSFFLGLILIQVFAISLPIFNFEASQSTNVWYVIGDWYSMTLPIMTLALITVAAFSRYMRSVVHGRAGPGLHQGGPGQGPARAAGPVAAPGPQRQPADGDADRPVPADPAGRQPDHRGRCSTTRAWGCSSTPACRRSTIR